MLEAKIVRGPRWRLLALAALVLLLLGCGGRRVPPPLPPEVELEQDRLLLFLHGYLSSIDPMMGLVESFTREGVPRDWIEPGRPGIARYHGHSFDYVNFTRAGSDHNTPIEALSEAFAQFYRSLPLTCPVCRQRADRQVKVTIVAHSFGGLVAREFLLREAEHPPLLTHQIPGLSLPETRWTFSRVITLGTPYFGSVRTRLSRGFLSLVVNGLVRTLVLGFVRPEAGGVFGNVIDAQARAVRIGSPYLWTAALRQSAWLERLRARGETAPPWLVITGVGHGAPEFQGDGLTRFPSANLAPLLPGAPMETLMVGAKHTRLIRLEREPGRLHREQRFMMRAMARFLELGTLRGDPKQEIALEEGGFFMRRAPDGSREAQRDVAYTRKKLDRLRAADIADVWMRFYEGLPRGTGPDMPKLLPLKALLSFFQNPVEPSRHWVDLSPTLEIDADGERIPTVLRMVPSRNHLIALPDLTPSGDYRMRIRLGRSIHLTPAHVRIEIEGQSAPPPPVGNEPGIPLRIRPLQTNLVHIYLDGRAIRAAWPQLKELDIREVALLPARP